jgi:hypothetical protein
MQTLAMNVVAPTVARFTPARPASKAFAPRCVRTTKDPLARAQRRRAGLVTAGQRYSMRLAHAASPSVEHIAAYAARGVSEKSRSSLLSPVPPRSCAL